MLLRPMLGGYKTALPKPDDVLLFIETSLHRDHQIKRPVYARLGIADYWIAHIDVEILLIHKRPALGHYEPLESRGKDQSADPLVFPQLGSSDQMNLYLTRMYRLLKWIFSHLHPCSIRDCTVHAWPVNHPIGAGKTAEEAQAYEDTSARPVEVIIRLQQAPTN